MIEKEILDLSKTIYQFKPYNYKQELINSESQRHFTQQCEELSSQLAQFLFTDIDYQGVYEIVQRILSLDHDSFYIPYCTFNSNSTPRFLKMFIHNYPNTPLFYSSLQLLEFLSRGRCIEQLFNNQLDPTFPQDLLNFIFSSPTNPYVHNALTCICNISNYSRLGAMYYFHQMVQSLTVFLNYEIEEPNYEILFYAISGYLQQADLFDEQEIINLAQTLYKYINPGIKAYQVQGLYCLNIILNNWKEIIGNVLNIETVPILIWLIENNENENILITSFLLLTTLFNFGSNEIKEFTLTKLSWNWYCHVWKKTKDNVHTHMLALCESMCASYPSLIGSLLANNILVLYIEELKVSKFNSKILIVKFLFKLIQNGNIEILNFLTANNFIEILSELFVATEDKILINAIMSFFGSYFELVEKNVVKGSLKELDNIMNAIVEVYQHQQSQENMDNFIEKLDQFIENYQ